MGMVRTAAAGSQPPGPLACWIRTPSCSSEYLSLTVRPGCLARMRFAWFMLIAALRDLRQSLPKDGPVERGAQMRSKGWPVG